MLKCTRITMQSLLQHFCALKLDKFLVKITWIWLKVETL